MNDGTRLRRCRNALAALLLGVLPLLATAEPERPPQSSGPAPTPPMGWNSWDAYGFTIDESAFKANAMELARLHAYGWTYAVIDEGWYMGNPSGDKLQNRQYLLDGHGRLIPVPGRFPSASSGQGFTPLANWVHARGLKFGIHIVRGIPRQAVDANLPIAGSHYRAADAADTADTCGWDDGNYGVRDNPAGQAYYNSMLALYAKWGLDFLKVDCIADHPYKASEIRQIAAAIKATGRTIVLSLSPGPTQLSHAAEIRRYGQMWRISNDVWDGWSFVHEHPGDDFPMGVRDIFDKLTAWAGQAGGGRWPDADMLPFGMLAPHPGLGEARKSRLTMDEQRTQLSLLAVTRSPLILGANLTQLDDATRGLITNREVIAVDQAGRDSHPVTDLPAGFDNVRVWVATGNTGRRILAVFNLDDKPAVVEAAWGQLGLTPDRHAAHDLWWGNDLAASNGLKLVLPAHGSALYEVK